MRTLRGALMPHVWRAAQQQRRGVYDTIVFALIDSVFSLDVFDAASFFAAMILLRRQRVAFRDGAVRYCRAHGASARGAQRAARYGARSARCAATARYAITRRSARVRVMPMPDAFHLRSH
jgi:hypothetical protein